jgi:enamine deaminase RidA (YjgF/YER057c/UK114 family)
VAFEAELIHTQENDPKWRMPYTPAIKVRGGATIYVAGVTAGPVYHSHPHVLAEFEDIPTDPGQQAEMALDNLERVLAAAGATLDDVVQLFRFIVDIDRNQDAINAVQARRMSTVATSTTVEVTRLASAPGLWLELTATAVVPE